MFNTIDNNFISTTTTQLESVQNNGRKTLSAHLGNVIKRARFFALIAVAVLTIVMTNANTAKAANGCSKAIDNPLGFNFKDICNEHDRGYGTSYHTTGYSYAGWKNFVDERFGNHLENRCNKSYSSWYQHQPCLKLARTYYAAVRKFGQNAYDNAQRQYPNSIVHNGRYWTQYQGNWFYWDGRQWAAPR